MLTIATAALSQNQLNGKTSNLSQTKISNLEVVVTVDSAKDIENTFKVEDIKEILNEADPNEAISFSLVCNGTMMSNGKKSTMTYKIEGNTGEPEEFLTLVSRLRKSAIKYYNN
ncbi:MAG: hypothetical protein ACX93I_05080 [Winogradskyella sp.]